MKKLLTILLTIILFQSQAFCQLGFVSFPIINPVISPEGSTRLSFQNTGSKTEQVTKATIGKGTIIIDGQEAANEQLSGLNRNITKTQELTKDEITGALDASLTVDNRIFTKEGRASISSDFKNFNGNLTQIERGLVNNIAVQSMKNTAIDKETSLLGAIKDYISDDKKIREIQADKQLTRDLNGLTNRDAEGVQSTLQKTMDISEGWRR